MLVSASCRCTHSDTISIPRPASQNQIRRGVLGWRKQVLSRFESSSEQAAEAVIYRLFQVLLATEITLGRKNGGVPEKKLYLLQFAATHMAEFCAGSPKVVRREVVEL